MLNHVDQFVWWKSREVAGQSWSKAFAAVKGSLELRHDVQSRWQGTCFWSDLYMVLYVSRMMCHIMMQPLENMGLGLLVMMTIHHLISMGCYILGLGYGRCHYWGCLDGCCEITTVFLNVLYLTNNVEVDGDENGNGKKPKLKDYLPKWFLATNGFLLWLAFLVFRLMLFPYWLVTFHQDMRDMPQITKDITTEVERVIYPGTTVILLCLSTAWFIPLTKGMLKACAACRRSDAPNTKKTSWWRCDSWLSLSQYWLVAQNQLGATFVSRR